MSKVVVRLEVSLSVRQTLWIDRERTYSLVQAFFNFVSGVSASLF